MLSLKAYILLLDSFCVFAQIQTGKFIYQKDKPLSTSSSDLSETSAPPSVNTPTYCALQCRLHPLCNVIELCHEDPDVVCRLHKFPNPAAVNENDKGDCQYFVLSNGISKDEGCEKEWQQFDGSCYRFSRCKGTFHWAKQWCKDVGGYLVRVDSQEENNWLTLQMGVKGLDTLWIGATDESGEGRFKWESNNVPITYSDWRRGQPDNHNNEDYVHIYKYETGYDWNDNDIFYKSFSACEK